MSVAGVEWSSLRRLSDAELYLLVDLSSSQKEEDAAGSPAGSAFWQDLWQVLDDECCRRRSEIRELERMYFSRSSIP